MINQNEQISLFKIIGTQLKKKVECIAIGGSAMMFYGLKLATKDVDLVFLKKEDLDAVKNVLYDSGFNERKNIKGIFRDENGKPIMMEGKETRFDLFLNEVIGFKMHKDAVERAKELHEFKNFSVKMASPEDILMMKGCTEREKDRDDAAEIIKKVNISWDVLINETPHQAEMGLAAFPFLLHDFLTELKEDYKIEVPKDIIKQLLSIAEKELEELSKKGKIIRVTKYKKQSL